MNYGRFEHSTIISQTKRGENVSASKTTGATCGAGSAYPPGAPAIIPSFRWGSCFLIYSFLCCVFVCYYYSSVCIFNFSHGVVTLFSIYEFDSPSGIFRPSFPTVHYTDNSRLTNTKILTLEETQVLSKGNYLKSIII